MLKIGINGLGRIGRAILRSNIEKEIFEVVCINDVNPDINNIAYTINYDTIYGKLEPAFNIKTNTIFQNKDNEINVYHENEITKVPWEKHEVDFIIDSSGVKKNVLDSRHLIQEKLVKKVFVTHCLKEVDFTMVLGVNESKYDKEKHHIISTSICDATAIAPTLKDIDHKYGVTSGSITTAHPWLNYQNLMDGSSASWSAPGEIFHHFALGRSAIGNIIPKPTTAVEATCSVLDNINEDMILSFSYRTPTAIVGSADLTLNLNSETTTNQVIDYFSDLQEKQKFQIYKNNLEPLVSLDFIRADCSAIVDHRWTEVIKGNLLKLVLWYDNEWGYSNRVLDQIRYVGSL